MFYTERLMFRAVELDHDSQSVNRWLNDQDYQFALIADAPRATSSSGSRKFWEGLIKRSDEEGFPFLAICERPDEKDMPRQLDAYADHVVGEDGKVRYPLIGIMNISHPKFSFTNRSVRLGIAFDDDHVGKGYGTEAMRWACDYVFNFMNVHRLQLELRTENKAAVKCYEKVGFSHEGIAKEAFYYDGSWHDTETMAMLEHQWRARRV